MAAERPIDSAIPATNVRMANSLEILLYKERQRLMASREYVLRRQSSKRPGSTACQSPHTEHESFADRIRAIPVSGDRPHPRHGKWPASHRRVEQQLSRQGARSRNQGSRVKVECLRARQMVRL